LTPTSSEWAPDPRGFGSPQPAGGSRYLTTSMISTAADSNIGDIFLDWAKTKPLTVATQDNIEKVLSEEELKQKFPPPRRVFSDGIPTTVKDRYVDRGYEVYYTKTTEQQRLRKKYGLRKSDIIDAKVLRDFSTEVVWHRHRRTEPEIVRLIELLKYREFVQKKVRLSEQYSASPMYKDARIERDKASLKQELSALNVELRSACTALSFHKMHQTIFGVGCITSLTTLTKRPWVYKRWPGGWLRSMGLTARPDYPTRHSIGSDSTLKKTIFGAKLTLIAKRSPWRSLYVKEKERLPMKVLVGKVGRGSLRITSDERAFNRVTTRIVLEIGELARKWAKERVWEPPFRVVEPE
jgi:hypothetical protein